MGLVEKRARKTFQKENFAQCVDAVAKIVGKQVEFEVDWDGFLQMSAEKAPGHWDRSFFLPLVEALEKIAVDDIGQEALNEQLNKVKVRVDNEHNLKSSWHDGMLVLNFKVRDDSAVGDPGSKTFNSRVDVIYKCLEANLE